MKNNLTKVMAYSFVLYSIYLITAMLNVKGVLSQSLSITEDIIYIRDNAKGKVTCTLNGNCGSISWYLSSITAPITTAFPGFACFNSTAEYYQTCDYQNHQYRLYFTGSLNLHGKAIKCSGEGCSPQQSISDTAIISIIVPVPSVSLEGNNGQQITVTAGQPKSITCLTGTSRPASHILWYIGGTNVTSSSTESINNAASQLYYTSSTLTFTTLKSQNGLQLNCKAYNTENNMVELTTKTTLSVQYPPDDTAAVIVGQSDSVSLVKGDIVTLECVVRGGNPLATITWNCFAFSARTFSDGNTAKSSVTFTASNTHNGGSCTCSATHPVGTIASDSIVIYVEYGPRVINYLPELKSYTLNEGDTVGPTQCVSDCNPKCNLVWTRPGQPPYTGENLTISSISRTQEGNYQCTGSNKHGTITGPRITVTVNYGPGQVTLNPSSTSHVINETYQLGPIKCFADCKLPCTYKWIGPNQNYIQGDTLLVNSIHRTQAGTYKCQATNVVGTHISSDIIVTVYFAAKLTSMEINGGNNFTIREHSTKTISCLAEGLPRPRINLRFISNSSILKSADGVKLDFTFPSAKCEDTGTYECEAINKFLPQNPIQKDVLVLCKPRAAQETLQNEYALSVGKTLNLTVTYIAYPRPIFQWFKNISNGSYTKITDGQQDVHITEIAVNRYTLASSFIRQNIKENGFGTYVLKAKNMIGTIDNLYIVRAKGKPDQPISGLASCEGHNSAVITWLPGFDNGETQTFAVVYREVGGKDKKTVSNIRDPGKNKLINYIVDSLRESTTYVFKIYSRNSFGESPRLEVNCSTSANKRVSSSTSVAVGAGLGSVIVVMLIVFSVIFLVRRFHRASSKVGKTEQGKDESDQKEYDTLGLQSETNVYNVIKSEGVYDNSGFTDMSQLNNETLQTTNNQSTYEQINLEDKPRFDDKNVYVNTAIR